MEGHQLNLPSDIIFEFGWFHITNSVLAAFAVTLIITIAALWIRKGAGIIPTRAQAAVEFIMVFFLKTLTDAYGSEARARKFLPLIMTFFLFLLIVNQFTIIPLVTSFTFEGSHGIVPLFRISTSDWSQALALALIAVVGSHIIALTINPIGHIGAFIRVGEFFKAKSVGEFLTAFINFFIGIMEIISEFARPVSLSARLFGNIFAGEMMLIVIAGIASFTKYVFPMPFIAIGIFVGLVQAFVFTFLTLLFMAGTVNAAGHSSH